MTSGKLCAIVSIYQTTTKGSTMAQKFIAAQVRTSPDQRKTTQIRGVFSQKKKLWEGFFKGQYETGHFLYEDTIDKTRDMTYNNLCNVLTNNGRVVIIDSEGERQAIIVAASENELRGWDNDESGTPVANPVAKDGEGE